MIDIRNLTMDYGSGPVIENVDLHIDRGETVVVIGGSGCGKSTLLRCINRLCEPTSGEILIDGRDIIAPGADLLGFRRKMGMVYQNFNLFSHLNVIDNITLAPMKVLGLPEEQAVAEADELLHRVGLSGKKDKMPDELSGGQKQRVAIARALAMHPELMLFDEPTSALDPTMVDEVESVIKDLVESGMTSVIVTHEMRFARNIASKVVFMAEGGIYETGTPEEIFSSPKRLLTQRFIHRSKMFVREVDREDFDPYTLASDLRGFLNRHRHNTSQMHLMTTICDELLYPVFEKDIDKAEIRLMCSSDDRSHMLTVKFPGIESDPLKPPYLDELNIKLLEHDSKGVFSRKADSGYKVCFHL